MIVELCNLAEEMVDLRDDYMGCQPCEGFGRVTCKASGRRADCGHCMGTGRRESPDPQQATPEQRARWDELQEIFGVLMDQEGTIEADDAMYFAEDTKVIFSEDEGEEFVRRAFEEENYRSVAEEWPYTHIDWAEAWSDRCNDSYHFRVVNVLGGSWYMPVI